MGVAHSSNFHGVQRLATDGKQGRENRPRIDSGGEEYSSWTGMKRNTGYAESDGGEDQR